MLSALGIAGHICPLPPMLKFYTTLPIVMTKYLCAGWMSQAEVTSALLAEIGYAETRQYSMVNTVFGKCTDLDPVLGTHEILRKRLVRHGCYLKRATSHSQYAESNR